MLPIELVASLNLGCDTAPVSSSGDVDGGLFGGCALVVEGIETTVQGVADSAGQHRLEVGPGHSGR